MAAVPDRGPHHFLIGMVEERAHPCQLGRLHDEISAVASILNVDDEPAMTNLPGSRPDHPKAARCFSMKASSVIGARPPSFSTRSLVPAKIPSWWSTATSLKCCTVKDSRALAGFPPSSPYMFRDDAPSTGLCLTDFIIARN